MKYYNIDKRSGDRRSTQSNIGNLKEAIPLSCELIPSYNERGPQTEKQDGSRITDMSYD
jgi:hypothetical protein